MGNAQLCLVLFSFRLFSHRSATLCVNEKRLRLRLFLSDKLFVEREICGLCQLQTQGVEINEHSAFTPDITPIILAAHKDNYECIKLLLDRGASIPHPHDVRCACKECLQVSSAAFMFRLTFASRFSYSNALNSFITAKKIPLPVARTGYRWIN